MKRISVLGPVSATWDENPVDLGGPTQRKLLAALVAAEGEVVSVPALLDALWGDDPPPTAPTTIQSYVSRLRKALGPGSIATEAPGYRFNDTEIEVDASVFSKAVESLPEAPDKRATAISRALDLWKGPAFEGFSSLEIEARSLHERRLSLEEDHSIVLRQLGRHDDSLAAANRVISAEPLRESAWLQRALTLHAAGRQPEAIKTLDEYRSRLGEVGLEPTSALQAVEDVVFEEPSAINRSVLPLPPDEFVGRAGDVKTLRDLMAANRLVTISGPGGMGKTRLGLEALTQVSDEDLIWFVALDSVATAGGVLPAILYSVGAEARGNPLRVLTQRLTTTPGLLFLDNCEHVIDEVARIASEVVRQSPSRVLATSREALNVSGEALLNLGPLESESAVRLFSERARRSGAPDEGQNEDIARLCDVVDRMPLAIEMAASRSMVMSPAEMIEHLSDRMILLERRRRGDAPRHETLEALVSWSYDLLDEVEKLVFQRLSVFSGPFGITAATEVACFDDVDQTALAGHVASLVERSLVVRRQDGGYRMLRVLRSFAAAELGEAVEPRMRHARFFAGLAGRIGDGLAGPDELHWIRVARAATDDMASAMRFAVTSGCLDLSRDILTGLFDWFYQRQPPALVDWGDWVLAATDEHEVVPVAAAWSSLAAMKRGDVEKARQQAERGIASTDGPAARYPLFMAGDVACYVGDLDIALERFDQQLVRASAADDTVGVIDAVAGEALALAYQGYYDRALAVAEGIELTARRTGSPTYIAYADYTLGESLVGSDQERAIALFQRAIARAQTVENHFIEGMALTAMGWTHLQEGNLSESLRSLQEGLAVYRRIGAASYTWTAIRYIALVCAAIRDGETATILMSAAEAAGRWPYGADEVQWNGAKETLANDPRFKDWVGEGTSLSIEEAADRAAEVDIATPQRR